MTKRRAVMDGGEDGNVRYVSDNQQNTSIIDTEQGTKQRKYSHFYS